MGLIVENLTFGYRCFPVLKGVDFSVETGNLVCMLGKTVPVRARCSGVFWAS